MGGRAYISVVRWPRDFTREQRAQTLADAMGIDLHTAGLRVAQDPPFVAGLADEFAAPDIIARFKQHKVPAFALTRAHIDRLPNPALVKKLTPADGAPEPMYVAELWRSDPTGFKAADIFLIVRGTVDQSSTSTTVTAQRASGRSMGLPGLGIGIGAGIPGSAQVSHTTTMKYSQLLDIYFRDHTLLRINSDRFSFDVLGRQRAFTAVENTDKLALLLAGQAPAAQVDTGFARFKPPPDFNPESFSTVGTDTTTRQRDETGAFDFYSGWVYTITRALNKQ